MQDSEPDIIDGVGAETGHVIRTTIGGRNGQSKQVGRILENTKFMYKVVIICKILHVSQVHVCLNGQTISYIAEHVVGTGSFGVVFQVRKVLFLFIEIFF